MLYDFEYNPNSKERTAKRVMDITANVRFKRDLLANISLYDYYDVRDGETPELIAEKWYGNAQYHWIVMLANEKFDYRNDFPLDYMSLQAYISDKYGDEADSIKHYVDANGVVVESTVSGAVSVSNREWEEDLNESKRKIRLPSRELIAKILKDFRDEM